ncbi:MAG: molybdopterin-synthase adenylyltransferase MoeB [Candidatus Abyssobacteria bacterium SURF_17]|uniref:Molybdopterin-synthase adenylyltransferase n=1 Tax=Candidatus Abyssobacteria bacterium SURF_17 TaxID=2093361 RepID=A0A419F968_9BACT|nr:MAG: molybdopterin-synthase adenylyltransferase MoeB [Candidatus Abyssubacteria bacterium SURF_17]
MFGFTEEEVKRYSRHIILKEVGGTGQRKLREARVLVVGVGGLGSPASYYLAAAGVGTIGIVDSDFVELSNLQRQILHRTDDIGRQKTESGAERLHALNPGVSVVKHAVKLSKDNVTDIIGAYDVIIDGVDNFAARYLLNDACFFQKKPLVEAGVLQFLGQIMTIVPGQGPCYRCVFPEPPPPGSVPSCQEAGILGAVPGVLGTLQAAEALKLILGIGKPLIGRIIIYEALSGSFREVRFNPNPRCPLCGERPTIAELTEYPFECGVQQGADNFTVNER